MRDDRDRAVRLRGVGHVERTDEDLALLRGLGVNAYRFSLEWSRIAPGPREWDERALARYVRIAAQLRESGIEPMVTLHHFTNPAWFAAERGWSGPQAGGHFLRFAEKAVKALYEHVRLFVTINEPNVFVVGAYGGDLMPPGLRNIGEGARAYANILGAHASAYDLIHAECARKPAVGIAHNMVAFHPSRGWSFLDRRVCRVAHEFYNISLIEALRTGVLSLRLPFRLREDFPVGVKAKADFLGVNYYFRLFLSFSHARPEGFTFSWEDRSGRGLTDNGWEVYPEGLEECLRAAALAGLPIIVTENGAAEEDDCRKIAYLRDHLRVFRRLAREGMDLRGYFWWSLVDNFEWLEGLGPRFGLFRVNFDTLDRSQTRVARVYSRLALRFRGTR